MSVKSSNGGSARPAVLAVTFGCGRLAWGQKHRLRPSGGPLELPGGLRFRCRLDAPLDKEQSSEMKRFRLIGAVLVAVFALGAIIASAAQAETAPSFTVGGTRLIAGKTHNIDIKATKPFVLSNPTLGLKIECKGVSTEKGVLLGSNPESPGRDDEILVFSGCTLVEGNGEAAGCHLSATAGGAVSTTITTEALKSEQVENVVSSKVGKQLLEEFVPGPGTNGFVTLFFGPAIPPCELEEAIVSGSVAGEVLLDNASEGKIELGQTPQERTSWRVNFPATPIKEVWLISSGVGKIQKVGQTTLGIESIQTGQVLTLLANTKFEPEVGLWSPLP